MELEARLEALRSKGLHTIFFRNAGVAFQFYTGENPQRSDWRKFLTIDRYYDTFTEALDAECDRHGCA